MKDTLTLFGIELKSYLRKVLYDLNREIVIICSTAVLGGLFFYIFGDFINDKLNGVSNQTVQTISQSIAYSFILFTHFFWYKLCLSHKLASGSLYRTFLRLGETRKKLKLYVFLSILIESIVVFSAFNLAIDRWIYSFSTLNWLVIECCC